MRNNTQSNITQMVRMMNSGYTKKLTKINFSEWLNGIEYAIAQIGSYCVIYEDTSAPSYYSARTKKSSTGILVRRLLRKKNPIRDANGVELSQSEALISADKFLCMPSFHRYKLEHAQNHHLSIPG